MKKSRSRLSALLVFAMLSSFIPFLSIGIPIAHAATTYYVSPTGTDSSATSGSSSAPWKTLAYAATRVPANLGNTIQLTAGTFIETTTTLLPAGINVIGAGIGTTIIKSAYFYTGDRSQYAENYFLIQAVSDTQVDGNQTFSGFTLDGDTRKTHGGIVVRHRNNVTVHDVTIQNFDWNGFWIHELSNNFQIYNSTFTNNSWGSTGYVSGSLQVGDLTNSSIHDITINEDTGYGIKALGYANRYFENVLFYNLNITVPAYGYWNGGTAPDFTMELHDSTCKNVQIYNSTFNNNVSLVGNSVGTNPTVRFHDNKIDAHNGYAIEVDYDYLEVDHNYIYGGPYPFANWQTHRINQTFHHNTIYDISASDVFRFALGVDNLKIYNNTFELNNPGIVNIVRMYGGTSANLDIKNNIFWSTGSTGSVIDDPNHYISSYTVSNNLFYNYTGAALGINNTTAAPQLTATGNRPSPYYVPLAGSPVIDYGVYVGYPYEGSAPDMGAYEYGEGALPSPWLQQDIGSVGIAGSGSYNARTSAFSVNGAGADVWGTADAFHFVYQTLSGDGQIIARVSSIQNTNSNAKAGVMIRETLTAGSKHAMMNLTPSSEHQFLKRLATDGATTYTIGADHTAAPYWVKLVRAGNVFSAYDSSNGTTWTLVATDTITMAASVYIGLMVNSHDITKLNTSTFDNVVVSSLPDPWLQQDIGSVGIAGSGSYNTGTATFSVVGSGANIWGTADAFHFVYKTMVGDGQIIARVASIQNTNSNAKAGVMIRETLSAGSKHVLMNLTPLPEHQFLRRLSTDGVTTYTIGADHTSAPYWVKLVRAGNVFSAYDSSNGTKWTLVATDTITMAASVYVGLAVVSLDNAQLNTSTFTNVSVTP